jgi:hypothetical protein
MNFVIFLIEGAIENRFLPGCSALWQIPISCALLLHRDNHIKKLLDSGKIREIRSKDDEDAKFGHKNVTQKFYGYKNHIAMTEERIISGIEVSDGAQPDVAYLEVLTMKSKQNGITVKEIVGDTAYVSRQNLEYCENQGIELIAKTNPAVAAAAESKDDGFVYNKDAGTLQCPTGELAMSVEKRKAKNGNDYYNFAFPKVVCRKCPLRATCRVGSSKERRYNLTIPNEKNRARLEYERSEVFRERAKLRQRVETRAWASESRFSGASSYAIADVFHGFHSKC